MPQPFVSFTHYVNVTQKWCFLFEEKGVGWPQISLPSQKATGFGANCNESYVAVKIMDSLFGRIPQILVFGECMNQKVYVPVTEIEHEGLSSFDLKQCGYKHLTLSPLQNCSDFK